MYGRKVVAFVTVVLILIVSGVVTGVSNLKDAIFPPKDDKETKTVTKVQKPEKQEDPPVSTPAANPDPVEEYSTQSTGEPEVSYDDEIDTADTAADSDTFTATMLKVSVAINMTTEEEMAAKSEAAAGIIATDAEIITNNYIEESSDFLNMADISAEEVANFFSYILYTSIQGDTVLNPDNPSSSVMNIYTQPNGVEIYRIIMTVDDNNNVDITMVLNESGYLETLNGLVEKLAYTRMTDKARQ